MSDLNMVVTYAEMGVSIEMMVNAEGQQTKGRKSKEVMKVVHE